MMRKIDAFLSRKAQEDWPTAIVWKEEASSAMLRLNGNGKGDGNVYILEREDHDDIILGHNFGEARAGLEAYLASARSKKVGRDAEAM